MRDRIDAFEERGAAVVVIGNGNAAFAQAFREDLGWQGPLLVDPELRAYRAAGLRRGRAELLSPRLAGNAWRALRSGHRQQAVQGDPWQLGGVLLVHPDGGLGFRQVSREAGDHADLDALLAALDEDARIHTTETPGWTQRLAGRALSALVDPTVALSFDRTGFAIHALGFDPSDLDVDLSGRRAAVTGANSGIGFETSLALADLGAELILLCRDVDRGEAAADEIRSRTGNERVRAVVLDVSDLDAVREVAATLVADPLDVLVHNAGVLPDLRSESKQGLERCFATHVAGPHLLTTLLEPSLRAAPAARVVWVSSGGMYTRRLQLDDPQWTERDYDGVLAYAETKRAQVVLAEHWASRFEGSAVRVNAMHPGWAETPSVKQSLPTFHRITEPFLRSAAQGADSVVWLAASHSASELNGAFVFDREARSAYWLPGTRETEEERARFIALCDEWIALRAAA